MQRRSFLALAGATSLACYAEPFTLIQDARHEWIEDKGDYVIIRVPDFKTFASETISKPAILLLGQGATARDVEFGSYLNLHGKPQSRLMKFRLDASRATTQTPRPTLRMNASHALVIDGAIQTGPTDTFAISVEHSNDCLISDCMWTLPHAAILKSAA